MAGTIIADYIRTDANKLSLNVGNTTFATINASGFFSNTGVQIINQNGQVNAVSIAAGTISTSQVADSSITQAKVATNVAGTGPAFSAYQTSATALTNGGTIKITYDTEEFDTANCFNATGSTVNGIPSYSFMPNVAGYYHFVANIAMASYGGTLNLKFYKNGSAYKSGIYAGSSSWTQSSCIAYMNGTTDYITVYLYNATGYNQNTAASSDYSWFQGYMIKAA